MEATEPLLEIALKRFSHHQRAVILLLNPLLCLSRPIELPATVLVLTA